ncbi:MAG TPA: hypothetical protein VIJ32_14810 [Actinomycetes bacterium]
MTATVGCDTWEDHMNASATATADTGRWARAGSPPGPRMARLREAPDAAGQRCC